MELGVLRFLLSGALEQGEDRFAMEVCKAIIKLSHAAETAKIRQNEMLAKSVVLGIAEQVADVLAKKVAGRFDGWEDCIDEAKREVLALVSEAKNPDSGPRRRRHTAVKIDRR